MSIRRFRQSAVCLAAVAAIAVGGAYCKTATKKAPAKAVTWVTRTTGKITCSVPSNWKRPKGAPSDMCAWYIGADENMPDGAFACSIEAKPSQEAPPGTISRKQIKVAGLNATQYRVKANGMGFDGVMVKAEKAAAGGKCLMIMAGSGKGEYAKYESTLRRMIASIKIKK